MMLNEICAEIKNYFTYERDRHIGDFSIVDGSITPSIDLPTEYFRIVGSHKNDGVHKASDADLVDEGVWHGAVWVMSPPSEFLALCDEIAAWQAQYGNVESNAMSPYSSESFGGYSYSKYGNSSSSSGGGSSVGWRDVYAQRLNAYRRIRVV